MRILKQIPTDQAIKIFVADEEEWEGLEIALFNSGYKWNGNDIPIHLEKYNYNYIIINYLTRKDLLIRSTNAGINTPYLIYSSVEVFYGDYSFDNEIDNFREWLYKDV